MAWMFSQGAQWCYSPNARYIFSPLGSYSLHGTSYKSSRANSASNFYCEIYWGFIVVHVYSFFPHNPKMQLEFLKLVNLMKAKGSKILCNVKTCWINMLSLTKRAMAMYMPFVAKMVEDSPSIMFTKVNFKLLCDINLLSFFLVFYPCLNFSMHWSSLHTKKHICIQLCCSHQDLLGPIIFSLCGFGNKMSSTSSKNFEVWLLYITLHLKWKTNTSLDLNMLSGEYISFNSSSYTFWVRSVNAIDEKVQVIWEVFSNLVEDAK
jgi:hypothetical protein